VTRHRFLSHSGLSRRCDAVPQVTHVQQRSPDKSECFESRPFELPNNSVGAAHQSEGFATAAVASPGIRRSSRVRGCRRDPSLCCSTLSALIKAIGAMIRSAGCRAAAWPRGRGIGKPANRASRRQGRLRRIPQLAWQAGRGRRETPVWLPPGGRLPADCRRQIADTQRPADCRHSTGRLQKPADCRHSTIRGRLLADCRHSTGRLQKPADCRHSTIRGRLLADCRHSTIGQNGATHCLR